MRDVFLAFFAAIFFASCSTWSVGASSSAKLYYHNTKGDLFLDCFSEGKITNTIIMKAGEHLSQAQIEHVFMTLHKECPHTVAVDIGASQNTVIFYDAQHRIVGILRGASLLPEPKTSVKSQNS
ncbi:MAG: hypothetical protein WCO68_01685 [Verrucomicrobiota bacterium]